MFLPKSLYILFAFIYAPVGGLVPVPPWKDSRIHILGNHGLLGRIHAYMAMPITRLIDNVAYSGKDVRALLHSAGKDTVDLGCGIGLSTPPGAIGVDCSIEMLRVGKFLHPSVKFDLGLAERWGKLDMCSVAICSFLLHEQTEQRRSKILQNAYRIARDYVLVMDIDPVYEPSAHMLAGEPFVLEYLSNIDNQIRTLFPMYTRMEIIPGHVILWNITKIHNNTLTSLKQIENNFLRFGT